MPLPRPASHPALRSAALAALTALALAGCGDDEEPSTTADPTPTGGATCSYEASGMEPAKEVEPPASVAPDTGTVEATISTSVGDLAVTLDAAAAPCTVNSFLSLADQGYFDDTSCHRLTTEQNGIFVLQCGDPTGSGSGGPGYQYADELTGQETYPAGTLAMANAGPDTNGSQFFIVYDDSPLDPNFTVFGQVDGPSTEIVADLAAEGSDGSYPDGSGRPNQPVDIESVTTAE